jgi:hypothetical protein
MTAAAIRFDTVTRRYGAVTAVDGVSFDVQPGEMFGLIGPDGAGKIVEGEIAGLVAAGHPDVARSWRYRRRQRLGRAFADRIDNVFTPRRELLELATPDTIVCRCEDVRLSTLDPSWSGRQAKLYTRFGMGPCQGAVCGPAVEQIFGWDRSTVRPPLFSPELQSWIDGVHGEESARGQGNG